MRSRDESAARLVHRGLDLLRVLLVGALGYLLYFQPGDPVVDLAVDIRSAMGVLGGSYGAVIVAGLFAPGLRWWRRLRWAGPALLLADYLLAVMVLVSADPDLAAIGWLAFLVPIVSSASLFGLLAAGGAWLAISAVYLPIRVDAARTDAGQELVRAAAEQVSLLAIVGGITGAVLVYIHQRMRETYELFNESQRFSTQLSELAFASRQLRQLTTPSDVLRGTVHDATRLGFADADICERRESRPWTVTHSSRRGERLPVDASLLSNAAVHSRGTVVRTVEEHEENTQSLHLADSRAFMATPIAIEPGRWLVLRAWMAGDAPEPVDHDRRALESLAALSADAWRHAEQIRHLAKRSKALAERARHDALTGLANRVSVLADLQERLHPEFGHSQPTALLYVDLEGFKEVNDQHGHDVGDRALVEVAGRLSSVVPDDHQLGRLGGDEFLVVVDLSTRDDPVRLAEVVCASLSEPIVVDDVSIQLGASVGIALAEPEVEAEELVRRADAAVYVSRQAGGGLHLWQDSSDAGEATPDWADGVVVALEPGASELPSWAQDLIDAAEAAAQLADALPEWDDADGAAPAPGDAGADSADADVAEGTAGADGEIDDDPDEDLDAVVEDPVELDEYADLIGEIDDPEAPTAAFAMRSPSPENAGPGVFDFDVHNDEHRDETDRPPESSDASLERLEPEAAGEPMPTQDEPESELAEDQPESELAEDQPEPEPALAEDQQPEPEPALAEEQQPEPEPALAEEQQPEPELAEPEPELAEDEPEPVAAQATPAAADIAPIAPHPDALESDQAMGAPHHSLEEAMDQLMNPRSEDEILAEGDVSAHSETGIAPTEPEVPHSDPLEDAEDVAAETPGGDVDEFSGALVADHVVGVSEDDGPAASRPATLAEALQRFDDRELAELEELPDI